MELVFSTRLSSPVLGLTVLDPADPRLLVELAGQSPQVVDPNTGELSTTESSRRPRGNVLSLQIGDLTVRAEDRVLTAFRGSEPVTRLTGSSTRFTSLDVFATAGGPLVAAGTAGGSVRLWNPRTGQLVSQSQSTRVSALVTFPGPDGRTRIATGGPTGGLRVWDPRLPAPPRTGLVCTRGFSDRVALQDLLDRGNLVQALQQLLAPLDDDPPTVITVEGAWGSGKSTLLELVRDQLVTPPAEVRRGRRLTVAGADLRLWWSRQRKAEAKPLSKPLVVSFNPWRHQSSEQVWAGLAKAVTEAAEAAIMPHRNARERYWFTRNAERVDRRHLQRQLWKRIFSPLLSLAGLGFGLSVLNALTNLKLGWAWWVTVGLAAAGALHTVLRYLFARASAFLPGELFAGPVTSNAFASTTTDPLIRDPYYNARAGYLYLVQHDVQAVLEDLNSHGYQPILLIDDLDRCTPRTTAQVFEAINVFLSDDFPAARFVLGLDTTVVAAHVDQAYKELADAKIVTHPDDPSPGWTFLRKLVQLPVRLPRTTADDIGQVLLAQLGPEHSEDAPELTPANGAETPGGLPRPAVAEQEIVAIERHSEVRDQLRRRLGAQPEHSVREEKRLLNVWQFYLRVLGTVEVEQAGHLVAVAEIAVRWPAYLHRLRGGWQELADAVDDDVEWGTVIGRRGFAHSDQNAAANLRSLFLDCDAQAVAALANKLF